MIKRLVRRYIPPAVRTRINAFLGGPIRYSGPYSGWKAASLKSSGYDHANILERVRETSRAVLDGKYAYEQDSVGFELPSPPESLVRAISLASDESGSPLRILDFGGSLGSSYHRSAPYLGNVRIASWLICEQPAFVKCGRSEFTFPPLQFIDDPTAALAGGSIDVLLLSSVLPYLPDPIATLQSLLELRPRRVLIDRTPLSSDGENQILVQHTSSAIYRATYPMHLLSFRAVSDALSETHVREWTIDCDEGPVAVGKIHGQYVAMCWHQKGATQDRSPVK